MKMESKAPSYKSLLSGMDFKSSQNHAMGVLIVIREPNEVLPLVRWGQRFARARDTTLQVLYMKAGREHLACQRLPILPEENAGDSVIQSIRLALDEERSERIQLEDAGNKSTTHKSELPGLWQAVDSNPLKVVLTQISQLNVDLLVLGKTEHSKHALSQTDLSQALLHHAHCEVMVLRAGSKQGQRCKQLVVPLAGGPHSMRALQLANKIAQQQGAQVTALNIQPNGVENPQAMGAYHVAQIMKKAKVVEASHLKVQIEVGNKVRDLINKVVAEDCDLVILGTSDHTAVSRMLFGTVDSHVMAGPTGTAVAVIRRARPLHSRLHMALEQFANQQIPQLNREERIELSERISTGSICSFDYLALMFLATSIAGLGLIQNSTAVVVGAMLVAPLMMPIIGAGLGLVQSNAMLVRLAAKSICYGFFLAIVIGLVMGFISPGVSLTAELAGRGSPNVLDLFIAFFSGIAAAYALARPDLSAALPGVAIAAALVPPLATIGISIAIGEYANAQGAALLFGTNVVAIIVGAALTLHAVGVRTANGMAMRIWVRRMILSLFLGFLVLAVPLSSVYVAKITGVETRSIKQVTVESIAKFDHCFLHDLIIKEQSDGVHIKIIVISVQPLPPQTRDALAAEIERQIGIPVNLELIRISADLIAPQP